MLMYVTLNYYNLEQEQVGCIVNRMFICPPPNKNGYTHSLQIGTDSKVYYIVMIV